MIFIKINKNNFVLKFLRYQYENSQNVLKTINKNTLYEVNRPQKVRQSL